jgi:DNA-binding response OmpR family regulator
MYIGLLEDEPQLAQYVCELLEQAGHTTTHFTNGAEMLKAIGRDTMDLFVLDWQVPLVSGLEVLKTIRQVHGLHVPVLFLTSRTSEQDMVEVLNAGADDYCTKPIGEQVLLARVAALLRRTYPDHESQGAAKTVLGYVFSSSDNTVLFEGQRVVLSEKEFKLALFLFENHERAVSRERLIQVAWGNTAGALSRSLDVHMSWLRKKLDLTATSPHVRLKPIYGYGYRLMTVNGAMDD